MDVCVEFGVGLRDLRVHVPKLVDAVCTLKRAIFEETGRPPVEQRLKLIAGTDSFSLQNAVRCDFRQRQPSINVKIHNVNQHDYETMVDKNDSVLDLKFLISDLVKANPEYIRLFLNDIPLSDDNLPLSQTGTLDPKAPPLRILFSFPPDKEGHGRVHRSIAELATESEFLNLCVNFRQSVAKFPDNNCLGSRSFHPDGTRGSYTFISYREAGERVSNIASGLVHLGISKGQHVGIMAINRPEWQLVDTACHTQGIISVPLYDTLGPGAARYILNHAEIVALFVQKEKLSLIIECASECPALKYVIVMDDQPSDKEFIRKQAPGSGSGYTHSLSGVEGLGAQNRVADNPPHPDAMATIAYTSGTTGNPKGVICSHRNLLVAADAVLSRNPPEDQYDGAQLFFSYLPLAHIYGRFLEISMLGHGNAIGYFQGDTLQLVDDVAALRPTFFPGVPRVWQKVYDRITSQIEASNPIRRFIFSKAFAAQDQLISERQERSGVWDRVVFSKVAAAFGGNLKMISSGSAPIAAKVPKFLMVALNARYGEGWGLSESCAAGTTTAADDISFGHVGTPCNCMEIKLVSVPDMNYLVTDKPNPRGEIWIRGANIFGGYYKEPEKTAAVMEDGWFMTGDVGMWLPSGNLKIIDRKKNIFKLSQGEYIRPEHIENVYKMNRFVMNAFVYGDSLKNHLVAVIVPDPEVAEEWAKSKGITNTSPSALCCNSALKEHIVKEMRKTGEQEGLTGFEHAKAITLKPEDFTVESGLLTPSMKLKRHQAKLQFKSDIETMYASTGKRSKL